jgi:hypothetical protein
LLFWSICLGQPKIQNLGVSATGCENVRGFDVSVNDPFHMCCVKGISNFSRLFEQLLQREGLSGQPVLQRLPFEQFHGNKGPALAFFNVVNRADVGMDSERKRPRLRVESVPVIS